VSASLLRRGVEVDEFLKVKGREDVYAVGKDQAVKIVECILTFVQVISRCSRR
jgi:hypothetical protein